MTTFKEIQGRNIRSYTTNPDNPLEGQMWYNQTDLTLKGLVASGAWSSAASSTNGGSSRIGFGIQTAGIAAGGSTAPGNQTVVEEYNGSGWSTETALPVSRQDGGGAGTTTAGLVWCGEGPGNLNTTQEYNGSSWTTTGNYPITARGVRGSGTQTAAIGDGGNTPAPAASNVSAEYNGSTWTAGNNLPGNRIAAATSGTQTSALATTGKTGVPNPTVSNLNTSYDGTSWTAETVYPLSLRQAVSTGTSSAANLVAGGVGDAPFGDAVTAANVWNGSSWTAVGNLGTKSTHGNGAGSSTASYINSGAQDYPSYPGVTQEYNFSTNVITPGAWASSGAMGTARSQISGFGASANASIGAGGYQYGPNAYTNASEEYNGSTFSATPNMPVSLGFRNSGGTITAGIVFAGHDNTSPTNTSLWDGSNYSNGPNLNNGGYGTMGNGSQTAAFIAGSSEPPSRPNTATEEYNGSSWSTVPGALNTGRGNGMGVGSQTAGLAIGGSPDMTNMEEYNGTAWTNGHVLVVGVTRSSAQGGSAPQDNTMIAGGGGSGAIATAQQYNGSSWVTAPSLATARTSANGMGAGNSTSSMLVAGGNSPSITSSEEFTGETTAVNIVDITTS